MRIALIACIALIIPTVGSGQGVAFEFNGNGDSEGWNPWHSIGPLSISGGVLACDITGPDPYLGSSPFGIEADANPIVLVRMKMSVEGTNQIFWTTAAEPEMDEAKSHRFQSAAAGVYKLYVLDLGQHPKWQGQITRLRIDPAGDSGSGQVEVDFVRICSRDEVPVLLAIRSLTATEGVFHPVGQPFEVTCVIENAGGQTAHDLQAVLQVPAGFLLQGAPAAQTLAALEGGTSAVFTWVLVAADHAAGSLLLNLSSDEDGPFLAMTRLFAVGEVPNDAWYPESAATFLQTADCVTLANSHIRAVFVRSSLGYGATAFDVRVGGSWRRMAVMPSFSNMAVQHVQEIERFPVYVSDVHAEYLPGGRARLSFSGQRTDAEGHLWSFVFRFTLGASSDVMDAEYSATPGVSEDVLLFEGPMLYAGAGTFGTAKDSAILPGLEWVVGEEVSSSTLDVTTDDALRYVPNTYKITTPWMALSHDGAAVGLMWNAEARPSAVFAVPDRFEGKAASLLGLFVPSVPDNVRENEREAYVAKHFGVGEGIVLNSGVALVCPADGPLAVQDRWYQHYGAPSVLGYPRGNLPSELAFTMEAFMDSLWLPSEKQWNYYLDGGSFFSARGRPPEFIEALELAARADSVNAPEYRARYDEAVAAGASQYNFELPFYVGSPDTAVAVFRSNIADIISQQKEDGSWRYDADAPLELVPGETAGFLGPDNAAEVGISGKYAAPLLQFARITGDKVAMQHAIGALEFMKEFKAPRAAQVWEVPVHTPDVLAASLAIRCFLDGYLLTGNEEYLAQAVYWARSALPFIYTWRRAEFPWMLYASIPVFGASLYTNPWFAVPVQWNGLDLAHSLLLLAQYDASYDWESIGKGVLVSGMYMQQEEPGWRGTYRDAFNVKTGARNGPLINPSLFMGPILNLLGWEPTPGTLVEVYEGAQVRVSSGASVSSLSGKTEDLSFALNYPAGNTTYTLVAGVTRPDAVERDGFAVPGVQDLSAVAEGWRYDPRTALLVLRIAHDNPGHIEIVLRGTHPRIPEILPEQRTQIRFTFDVPGDFEGWWPANDIAREQVGNGALRGMSLGPDPYVVREYLAIGPRTADCVLIRMRTTQGSAAEFFWTTSDQPFFSQDKSFPFALQSGGQYHDYFLNLGSNSMWAGKIVTGIRVDPTAATSSEFDIDFVVGGPEFDLDSDGIADDLEGPGDPDADGLPNYVDYDSDGDSIPDSVEGTRDADEDGTRNFLDTDSDDDGLVDSIEGADDLDGDGFGNFVDLDSDGDGWSDALESQLGTNPYDASDATAIPCARSGAMVAAFVLALFLCRPFEQAAVVGRKRKNHSQ